VCCGFYLGTKYVKELLECENKCKSPIQDTNTAVTMTEKERGTLTPAP